MDFVSAAVPPAKCQDAWRRFFHGPIRTLAVQLDPLGISTKKIFILASRSVGRLLGRQRQTV